MVPSIVLGKKKRRLSDRQRPPPRPERPRIPTFALFRMFVIGSVAVVACVWALWRSVAVPKPPMVVPAPASSGVEIEIDLEP